MRATYCTLLAAAIAAGDFQYVKHWALAGELRFPLDFARSGDNAVLVFGNDESVGAYLFPMGSGNVTYRDFGAGTQPFVSPSSQGFLLLKRVFSGFELSILSSIGEETNRRVIETAPEAGRAAVAELDAGEVVVVWEEWQSDGDQWGIVAHLMDGSLSAIKGKFRVNSFTQGSQRSPSVLPLHSGFLVAWLSEGAKWGVYGQVFDGAGNRAAGEDTLVEGVGFSDIAFAGRSVLVARRTETLLHSLYLQRFSAEGKAQSNAVMLPREDFPVDFLLSPALELQDQSLLAAANTQSWPDAVSKSAVWHSSSGLNFCWSLRFGSGDLLALDMFSSAASEVSLFLLNLSTRIVSLLTFPIQLSVQCPQSSTGDFPVAWTHINIHRAEARWKLVVIIVPSIVGVLLLLLFAAALKACIKRVIFQRRVPLTQAEMSSIDRSVDSVVSGLNSPNRAFATLSAHSRASGINSADVPEILMESKEHRPLHYMTTSAVHGIRK